MIFISRQLTADGCDHKWRERKRDMLLDRIMIIGGIAGVMICTGILCVLPHFFEKQRRKLLQKIKDEF